MCRLAGAGVGVCRWVGVGWVGVGWVDVAVGRCRGGWMGVGR